MDEPVTTSPTNVLTLNKSAFRNIDKFIKSASISSYKKGIQNVGIVSCFYSLNIQKHNIKDYISLNSESASRVIVPVFHESRIVIFAFFAEDFRVEYYDSLKKDYCEQFHSIKSAVENFLGIKFNTTNQNIINEEFNDNSNAELANVHICRIAEALIFNQNKKLNPFDIKEEAKRIYKIMDIVSDPGWKGKWIFDEKDGNYESAFERVKNDTTRRKKCVNSLSTSGSVEFEVGNSEGRIALDETPTQREININSIIDEVISSVRKRPKTNTSTAENIQTEASIRSNGNNSEDATIIETLPEVRNFFKVTNNYSHLFPHIKCVNTKLAIFY
uniref:Uncharacterized protein n=1 Tax=Panagrolaimus davidi TaxID=227884 RepID=A0A914QRU1_9BILA